MRMSAGVGTLKRIRRYIARISMSRPFSFLKDFFNRHLNRNISAKVLAAMCTILVATPAAAFMIFKGNGSVTGEPVEDFTSTTVDMEPLVYEPASEIIVQSSSEESIVSVPQSSSQAPSSKAQSSQPKTVEQQVEQIKKVEKPREDNTDLSNAPKEEYHAPSMPSQAPPAIPSTSPPIPAEKYQINVTNILQNPSLPTGCEITSLTMVLNYYKYSVSKETMADNYLPYSVDFGFLENGQKYGPDFRTTFAGNPRSAYGLWLLVTRDCDRRKQLPFCTQGLV